MVPPPPKSAHTVGHGSAESVIDSAEVAEQLLVQTARAVAENASLETLSRPFLDLVHRITGLESVYLSEVHADQDDYEVLFADNRGSLDITEGLHVSWRDSLCRRAFDRGIPATTDATEVFADSPIAMSLGVRGFVSVPVISSQNEVMGTLCSASASSAAVPQGATEVMRMLAELLANQWERDRHLADERRRADHAEKHLRTRATMLAEAEHKLKTPLTVIRGWSELMVQDWADLSDSQRIEGFRVIHSSAVDASRQVEQLLEEARSEVLSTELRIEIVDARELIDKLAHQLAGVAGDDHAVSVDGVAVALTLADREALWQAVWHLAENALKYSPDGGAIEFSVEIDAPDDGSAALGPEVRICVRDHGLGLPHDVDIFAPFVRGGKDAVGTISGSGIGLHVVRTLITAMHGTVSASSGPDQGSIFCVCLPTPDQQR